MHQVGLALGLGNLSSPDASLLELRPNSTLNADNCDRADLLPPAADALVFVRAAPGALSHRARSTTP